MTFIVSRLLESVDLFASKIQLTVFQKEQKSSPFSQTLTILVAFCTIIILKDDLYKMIAQTQPQVLNTQQSQKEPPNQIQQIYQLQPYNFTYAIRVFKNNQGRMEIVHGIDKYYQYSLSLCHRIRFGNGTETNNCTQVPLEECSLSKHFQTGTQYEYFKLYNFTSMRCINYEWWNQNQLLIGGTIYSRDFYYLNLFVSVCRNTTLQQTCSPKDVIDANLQGTSVITYISTNQIDHSQKGNPYSLSIKAKYTLISQVFAKASAITFSASKTLTDVGYIQSKIEENDALLISSMDEYTNQIQTNQIMFTQVLSLDDVLQVSIREYDKFTKIVGLIGGLFSVLYKLISFISHPFILAGLKLNLVNWITKKSIQDTHSNEHKPFSYFRKQCEQIKNTMKILFGVKIKDQNNLEIILKHLDINYLIEKILEIEKLKLILFDDEQYQLFNLLPMINQHNNKIEEKIKKHQPTVRSQFISSDQKRIQIKIPNTSKENRVFSKIICDKNEFSMDEIEEGKIQQIQYRIEKSGSGVINHSGQSLNQNQFQSPNSPAQETFLSPREQIYRKILFSADSQSISDNNQKRQS